MNQIDTAVILERLRRFSSEREWDQFHNPKNLVMALSGECGELSEIFQWLSADQSINIMKNAEAKEHVEEEVADVFLYLVRICDKLHIDLESVALHKMDKNEIKYPVEKSKGHAKKYTDI